MKKIKNKSDLLAFKMGLRVKELELEKAMQHDWTELKEKLQLKNKGAGESTTGATEKHWLVSGMGIGANILTRVLLNNAGEKLEGQLDRGVDKILNKVQGLLDKRKKKK
jgi:hypothetical protein